LVVLTVLLGLWYFKKEKRGYGEGLKVGLIMLITSNILDSVITIPLFMNGDYGFLISPMLVIGEVIGVVVIMVLVGCGRFFIV